MVNYLSDVIFDVNAITITLAEQWIRICYSGLYSVSSNVIFLLI